ncbi:MAG: tol-pal system protein YbgF, partial [Nitrospirae bacterium]
ISLCVVFAGCVASSTDMQILQNDLVSLTNRYNAQQLELKRLRAEIKKLRASSEESSLNKETFNALREGQVALNDRIDSLSRDLQALQNSTEESLFRIEKAVSEAETERAVNRAQIDQLLKELNELKARVDAINNRLASLKTPPPPPAEKPAQKVEEKPKPQTPEDFYNLALEKLRAGKTVEARKDFEDFIKRYPQSDLADNAQYWIGESYYKEGNYEDAILAYDALIKNYKDSNKIAAAKLKQAYAFLQIGDKNATEIILKEIIKNYPKSEEANLAKKKLEEIKKAGSKNK